MASIEIKGSGGGAPLPDGNLQIKNGLPIDATLQTVSDVAGNDSILNISTESVGIGTTTATGLLNLFKPAAAVRLMINGDAGQNRLITYRTGGVQRIGLYLNNTAETGSNVGSDFAIRRYTDAGTLGGTPLFVKRSTGNVGINTLTPAKVLDVNGDALINTLTVGLGSGNISTNTAVGNLALNANTSGAQNTAIGEGVLKTNLIGFQNTAVGNSALMLNTGSSNTAVGYQALNNNSSGGQNTAIGLQCFSSITSGGNNTAIGFSTGGGITTGSRNTIIGANVNGLSATLSDNIIIADGNGSQRINVDSSGNVAIGGELQLKTTSSITTNTGKIDFSIIGPSRIMRYDAINSNLNLNQGGFGECQFIGNSFRFSQNGGDFVTPNSVNSNNAILTPYTGDGNVRITASNNGNRSIQLNGLGPSGSVLIGNIATGNGTNYNAICRMDSTSQGFLPPRMTTAEKNLIGSPSAGLMVYDTTLNKLCVYTTAWETITSI